MNWPHLPRPWLAMMSRDARTRLISFRTALAAMNETVGKTPLRKLVKSTVEVVEQHYVRAALQLADGNRTTAAEILGLSRQSLYAKLDRYNLNDKESDSEET